MPPAPDVVAADVEEQPEVVLEHPTCGVDFFGRDAGLRRIDSDAAVPHPLIASPFRCEVPDAGVAWSFAAVGSEPERIATLTSHIYAAERRRGSERMRGEIIAMDRESRDNTGRWVVPGFLFRAPDRARGKFVRIEGAARDVSESNGTTTLAVSIDAVGREVIRVTLPDLADDRVVSGADVVVYGIANGSHTEVTRLGAETMVPDVVAIHIEPQSDTEEDRSQRLLRRLGRHRF